MKLTKLLLGLVLLLSVTSLAVATPIVQLQDVAYVSGTDILLGDIGTIEGETADVQRLAQVNVGRAPLAGSSRRLTIGQIEVRLRRAGIDPKTVEFDGPKQTEVHGEPDKPKQLPESVTTTADEQEPAEPGYQVLVATRNISRGEILASADLKFQFQERPAATRDFGEIPDYVGKQTVRYLSEGSVVTPYSVEIPPVIERGDRITIQAQAGAILITAPGIARSSGGLGEIIPVENTASRQVVYGQIVSNDLVEVNLGGNNP